MKRIYVLLAALVIAASAFAQATPHEKAVLKNDVARERDHRNAVARDVLTGHPQRAKANHRAAVAYHKKTHRDARIIHHNEVVRAKARHNARKRHYRR